MEIANEPNQPKDNPINIWEEFKSTDAAAGMAMENNTTNDETQPLMQQSDLNRTGDEITEIEPAEVNNQVWSVYWPLCQMIQENDWKGVEDFVGKHPKALTEEILYGRPVFFYLIGHSCYDEDGAACLIENLACKVRPTTLEQKDSGGLTLLTACSWIGNTRVSKLLVKCNPQLPNIESKAGWLPIHDAAMGGHKDLVRYLIQVTAEDKLKGISGANLISWLIRSNLYDVALDFLKQYKWLGRDHIRSRIIVLDTLAEKPMAFASGSRLGRLQRFIYDGIPVKKDPIPTAENPSVEMEGDLENLLVRSENDSPKPFSFESLQQTVTSTKFGSIYQELNRMFWKALVLLVPCIKVIREQKVTHVQTAEILRMICEGIVWSDPEVLKITSWQNAARFGISEIVYKMIMTYHQFIFWTNHEGRSVFHLAVLHRKEKVFNIIYHLRFGKETLPFVDNRGNNMLHLVAESIPSSEIAGAALQMQRELQWFKAVEDLMRPTYRVKKNGDNKTPREVFTASHRDLVKEGEKWMKDTASSCTIAVALIITVVFAAAFTVPGGNNDEGIPNFLDDQAFLIFAISDALALFSSITSLLMFLGILTSRYAENDFLVSLPRRLIIGLITLFFSTASMMIAFGATIYTFLSRPWKWITIPISLLGCIPVTLFALLQFPLLVDMVLSTYGPSIFGPNK